MKTGPISMARRKAIHRRAMKRWLRAHGRSISERERYDESALRKKIRDIDQKGDQA